MIAHPELSELLNQPADAQPLGQVLDCVLDKKPGVVRRQRDYRVYLPSGYDGSRALPMLMVLHGCRQNHTDIQAISCFDRIADREQFIVVYPFITTHTGLRTQNCWGWWMGRQRQRDKGENGDLHQVVTRVIQHYAVDQSRLHICGLSAGAAMSVVALATYSDIWHSGASVAGVAFGETAHSVKFSPHFSVRYKPLSMLKRMLERVLVAEASPLLVIQSEADEQVRLQSALNLQAVWRHVCDLPEWPSMRYKGRDCGNDWELDQYLGKNNQLQLASYTVKGIKHGWMGGGDGRYTTPDAPNISELIWAFFDASSKTE